MIHRHSWQTLDPSPANLSEGGGAPPTTFGGTPIEPVAAQPSLPTKKEQLKPVQARPPTEAEKKVEFKLEPIPGDPDFLKSFATKQLPTQEVEKKPVIEAAKPSSDLVEKKPEAVVPKVEEKKADTPAPIVPEAKKSILDGPIVPPTAKEEVVDYTQFTEQQQGLMKKMANDAKAEYAKVLKENKELSKLKGAEYLQHEEAFTLSPEYKQMQSTYENLTKESIHWNEQLLKISKGEEWQGIAGYDKNGNIVLMAPQKPTKADEIQVSRTMNMCLDRAGQIEQQAVQMKNGYREQISRDNQQIDTLMSQQFGWHADPKMLEQKITIANGTEKSLKQVADDFLSMVPAYRRNSMETKVAANLWIALQIYGGKIRQLEGEKQVAEIKTQEVRRAEPTSEIRPSSNGATKAVNGIKTFDLAGLPA